MMPAELSRVPLIRLAIALLCAALAIGVAAPAPAQEANAAEAAANGDEQQSAEDQPEEAAEAEQPAPEEAAEAEQPAPAESAEAATNVADSPTGVAESDAGIGNDGGGTLEFTPAPLDTTIAPGTTPAPGELPSVAEGQPGFIPDREPQDLMEQQPSSGFSSEELEQLFNQPEQEEEAEHEPYSSPLGPSKLPSEPSEDIISRHDVSPDRDLPPNHARIVVPVGGTIQGSTETKQFHIEGGLTIYYSDVTILGQVADIDEKNEVAVLRGGVNILDPEYSLKTDELRIYFEDKRFEALGFVQFKKLADPDKAEPDLSLPKKDRLRDYFAGKEFELYCTKLFYDWDNLSLTALDSVRIKHPVFNGSMDRLDYNDDTKEYEMSGSPVLEATDYDWIFETKLVDEGDEDTVRALAEGNTKITCDRVVYTEDSGVAQFYALPSKEVSFVQPTRSIKASYVEVNDQTKDFHAEGSGSPVTYQQTEGDWLFAGGLINRDEVSQELVDALEGELSVQANELNYNFDRKRLALRGQVAITGGERQLQANELVQDQQAKFFLLRGNVLVKPDSDSQVMAAQVFIDTDKDIITLVGLVDGELHSKDLEIGQPEEGEEGAGGQQVEVAQGVFGTSQTNRGTTNVAEGG